MVEKEKSTGNRVDKTDLSPTTPTSKLQSWHTKRARSSTPPTRRKSRQSSRQHVSHNTTVDHLHPSFEASTTPRQPSSTRATMPRPEGFASAQFEQIESTGKQVMVQCRHCHNKKLSRSVASRKKYHLYTCTEFHRYVAELQVTGSAEYLEVPDDLKDGPVKPPPQSQIAASLTTYPQNRTPASRRPPQFEYSLPALLDGLDSGRRGDSLDEIREWNRNDSDAPMNDSLADSAARPSTRPSGGPDSVPERSIAFAHRAAQRRKERLDNILTRAIYEGSLPFNVSDPTKHPAMAEFFRLIDYTPPNRHRIADDVYDQAYDQAQDQETIPYAS